MTRKKFIGGALAAGVAPAVVPSSVFGKNAPSNRITVGGIGVGGIGKSQIPQIKEAGFEVVSLCDLDWEYSKKIFNKFPDARKYKDYRKMIADEGDKVDAYYCGCPDHWHTLVSLAVLKERKHLCCVKPLTRKVDECRMVVAAAKKAGTATQVTACTSNDEASVRLYEILDAGLLGEVRDVAAWSRRPVWPLFLTGRIRSLKVSTGICGAVLRSVFLLRRSGESAHLTRRCRRRRGVAMPSIIRSTSAAGSSMARVRSVIWAAIVRTRFIVPWDSSGRNVSRRAPRE